MTFLKGFVKGKLNNIKNLDIDKDKFYNIEDLPDNGITNEIMQAVLSDNKAAAFLTLNNTYVCIDAGTYKKGITYKFNGDSWEELSAGGGIEQLVGTQEKPINLATDLEVGKLYALNGYIRYSETFAVHNMDETRWTLAFKESSKLALFFNVKFGTLWSHEKNVTTFVQFSSTTGNISSSKQYVAVTKFNGVEGANTVDFYAPTTAGTQGQILQSNGSSAPTWVDISTLEYIQQLEARITSLENQINEV